MKLNIKDINELNIERSKEELYKNGYTVLRNILPISFLKEIEKEAVTISWSCMNKVEVNTITTLNKCTLSSIHNLANYSKSFRSLYKSSDLRDIYNKLTGKRSDSNNMINSSYFFKQKESGRIKIHQDNAYFNLEDGISTLTFYIPVHYQSKNRGTIYYFSGTHKLGEFEHVAEGNIGASMCIKRKNITNKLSKHSIDYVELFPGDISIHNALVVHGTLANQKDEPCEAFNFTLFDEENVIMKEKYLKYKSLLKHFLKGKH